MRTVAEFAKHFDLALHQQDATKESVLDYCRVAVEKQVSAFYTNPYWSPMVAAELKDSGVKAGGALGFPFGAYLTETKMLETQRLLEAGCSTMDMVVNIGELRAGNWSMVSNEIEVFTSMCHQAEAWAKIIFEVCFLTQDEIAQLTRICCEIGVDFVKTASGQEGFPDLQDIETMQANLSGGTRIKVSGVPRTLSLGAALFLLDNYDVGLLGTRSAAKIIDQYAKHLMRTEPSKD
jgi:deoxyribose-phosphate aldolase